MAGSSPEPGGGRTGAPAYSLAELARRLGGRVVGDPATEVSSVRALDRAGRGDLSFVTRAGYLEEAARSEAARSEASAFLRSGAHAARVAGLEGRPLLVVEDPSLALARVIEIFHPPEKPASGIHEGGPVARVAPVERRIVGEFRIEGWFRD